MDPRTADFLRCVGTFDAEFDYVHQVLRRHGVSASDAEDLTQEVFLVMWRRWSQYDVQRPIRPWLAGIAFRVAYNHRQRALREVPGGLIDLEDHRPDPEQTVASDNTRTLVWRVLASLSEKHRFWLLTHHVDGLSVREIADTLALPVPTAHTRLRAARRAFAKAVRQEQEVSMTRARLAPLLRAFGIAEQAAETPAAADSRRRAVARARRLALVPGFGLAARERPPTTPAPVPLGPTLGRAWLPVGGAAFLGGAILLLALVFGDPPALSARTPALSAQTSAVDPAETPAALRAGKRRPRAFAATAPTFVSTSPVGLAAFDPSQESARLQRGLVGYWRFDEPSGSSLARDLSGNGNDCLLRKLDSRGAWTEGRLGGAVALDGLGWLECPRTEALARLGNEMSISLWLRRTGSQQRVRALVSRQYGSDSLDNFHLGFRNGELWMRTRFRGQVTRTAFPRANGSWHHLAVTLDAAGRTRLFVDGAQVALRERDGQPPLGGGDNPLIIGGGLNSADRSRVNEHFQGVVDEVAVYARKLDAAEVRALAAGGQPRID
jgi:RNA polymerase sigma factor (sigma-70 family)